jgi:hypothetical protein
MRPTFSRRVSRAIRQITAAEAIAAEVLRRVYGEGHHDITMANPALPGLTFHYTTFDQITSDISDARI